MTTKQNTFKEKEEKQKFTFDPSFNFKWDWKKLYDRRLQWSLGFLLLLFSFFLFFALISYIFTGKADQSVIENISIGNLTSSGKEIRNWLGIVGARLAHFFIFDLFGLASIFMLPLIFCSGYSLSFKKHLLPLKETSILIFFITCWVSLLMGCFVEKTEESNLAFFLCGAIGYQIAVMLYELIGWGTVLFLIFSMGVFLIYFFKEEALNRIKSIFNKQLNSIKTEGKNLVDQEPENQNPVSTEDSTKNKPVTQSWKISTNKKKANKETLELTVENKTEEDTAVEQSDTTHSIPKNQQQPPPSSEKPKEELPPLENKPVLAELPLSSNIQTTNKREEITIDDFDPTLDLGSYRFPNMELLNEDSHQKAKVTREELEENKDKIIETLNNFKVGVVSIKATIGPTVTLYEIVPEAGIKISKIRNLEDDIALNLSALGIRIIAPIPGKGTIGIEVPNKQRNIVSIRSVLETEEFMNSNKELPIAWGKTVSDEVFVTDLAKMPHLLMAGATGQGKSVGLNVILSSLLYSKHPSKLKFV